jgi:sugar lactone lactonase YvrE
MNRTAQVGESKAIGRRAFLLAGAAALAGEGAWGAAPPPARALRPLLAWGKKGKAVGELNAPIGLAINARDEIFVSEASNNRVQWFTPEGKALGHFPVEPMPGGLAVDRAGNVYVAPLMSHKVCVYSPGGKLLRQWGKKGKGDGEFDQPGGIAIAPDGSVYVADQVNRRVQRFTAEGKFLLRWGEYGTRPGQFDGKERLPNRTGGPNFVAVDRHGNVYTTEAALGRVQKFDPRGRPLLAFGSNGTGPGGFGGRPRNLPGPIAICLDGEGRIWVSSTNNRVQLFSPRGEFLRGALQMQPGEGPGRFHTPHGLVLDRKGCLYVADSQNHRVQKFAV